MILVDRPRAGELEFPSPGSLISIFLINQGMSRETYGLTKPFCEQLCWNLLHPARRNERVLMQHTRRALRRHSADSSVGTCSSLRNFHSARSNEYVSMKFLSVFSEVDFLKKCDIHVASCQMEQVPEDLLCFSTAVQERTLPTETKVESGTSQG